MRDAVELSRCLPVLFLGLIVGSTAALGDEPATDVRIPPPFETFLVIPLRVHVLSAPDLPEIDCKLRDEDVTRIVGKINGVWKMAGLHWGLDAIVREPAARQEKFKLARALGRGANLGIYRLLAPDESRDFDGLHVYYIHEFAVNGVWLGAAAFVQETAELREVKGGIDEPIPRVTAHELGHALGLSHRQDRTNLLASGTTGTLINTREVESVRKTAKALAGVKTVAELKAEATLAEKSGDHPRARIFWTWLAEIPGADGEPKAALERLRVEDGDKGVTFFDGIQGGFYIEQYPNYSLLDVMSRATGIGDDGFIPSTGFAAIFAPAGLGLSRGRRRSSAPRMRPERMHRQGHRRGFHRVVNRPPRRRRCQGSRTAGPGPDGERRGSEGAGRGPVERTNLLRHGSPRGTDGRSHR